MTIADMIGQVDVFSAAVALGIGAGMTIVGTTALARTPRRKMQMDFELAQMKQQLDHDERKQDLDNGYRQKIAQMGADKEIEFKRIDSGMVDLKNTN